MFFKMLPLTIDFLLDEAKEFAVRESGHQEPKIFGITDGKAIGTYFERKFISELKEKYDFDKGNSSKGIDLPCINVDIKVTSVKQPQSSCPFKTATQKIYGLGYHLLVFVYDIIDNDVSRTGNLSIKNCFFIDKENTSDRNLTNAILKILDQGGTKNELITCLESMELPASHDEMVSISEQILSNPPKSGCIAISNALQWRLNYSIKNQQFAKQII